MDFDRSILYHDNHLIAVDKPAGVLSQGDHSGDQPLVNMVQAWLKVRYQKPGNVYCALLHRLDRSVSGVLLFGKTSKAAERMSRQFREGAVKKLYLAVAQLPQRESEQSGDWTELRHVLQRRRDISIAQKPGDRGGTEARLRYRILHDAGQHRLLLVQLITGQKHQIRAQLASAGMPIIGDVKYGAADALMSGAICLHALCVRFIHPVRGEPVSIIAPVPDRIREYHPFDYDRLVASLGEENHG